MLQFVRLAHIMRRHVNSDMSVTSIALRQTANCFRTKALEANFEKQFAGTDR